MDQSDDLEGELKQEVGEDVPVHNTKDPDEVFLTSKSRLKLALLEYEDGVKSLRGWANPFILLITVVSILLVADYQQTFGMSGDFWLAAYFMTGVISLIWLIYAIFLYLKNRKKAEIDSVIQNLKRNEN